MLSIGKVASAGAAGRYFDRDNYYGEGETSPSVWLGQGAKALGLAGSVEGKAFEAVLDGHVPDKDRRLGYADRGSGEWKHQPGWDLTFSAPKSVTLLAMLGGDRRIVAAHDRAVAATITMVERNYATTRLRRDGAVVTEKTGNLVVAAFRHDLSRLQEPQLHTHAVTANMTEGADGTWRSLVSRTIYIDSKTIGMHYQQELALELRRLGYEIDPQRNGTFEVRGVSKDLLDAFSTRRAEVVDWLTTHGIDPERATQEQTRRAALATRNNKIAAPDRADLARDWQTTATGTGIANLVSVVQGALARGPAEITAAARAASADGLLGRAIATVAEHAAAWTPEDVLKEAGRLAPGHATSTDLRAGLDRLAEAGRVVARNVTRPDPKSGTDRTHEGLTLATEKVRESRIVMLALARSDAGAIQRSAGRTVERAARAGERAGQPWNEAQKVAARALLESPDAVTGLQGLAGTAKTTTVLATLTMAARDKGYEVTALAPTAAAADELGRAIDGKGKTVTSHLLRQASARAPGKDRAIWIVDEASMLSTGAMEGLLVEAGRARAKVILVGDVHQLGAVEAGAPFRQLQEAGMTTAILDRVVRQRSDEYRGAVTEAAAGRIAQAIDGFERAGGQIVALADAAERFQRIAADYAGLSREERGKTVVIEPSIKGRARLNADIRAELLARGALDARPLAAETHRRISLTRAEARETVSYLPGTIVRFRRGYRLEEGVLSKGEYLTVTGTSGEGRVLLEKVDGTQLTWRPGVKGSGHVELFERDATDLRRHDRLQWHENATLDGKTVRNGQTATVVSVDPIRETAVVKFEGAGMVRLDLTDPRHRHWSHAYAQTAHAVQGRTAERVLAHTESGRINLVNSKSFYVAISRAREQGTLYTDDRDKLLQGLEGRKGEIGTALERPELKAAAEKAEAARHTAEATEKTRVERIVETLHAQIAELASKGRHSPVRDPDNNQRQQQKPSGARMRR